MEIKVITQVFESAKFTELKNMDKNEIKNIDRKGIFKNCFD